MVTATLPRAAALGALSGAGWGVLARIWMRLISTDPEFSWTGTLLIIGFAALLGGGVGLAAGARLAGRSRWGAAGVCAALATLTKQVGGVMLIPLVWMVWTERATPAGQRQRGNGARLAAGFLLPIVVAALLTGPGRFLFWTVTGSGSYASASGSWLLALGRALGNAGILAAACAGLLAPIIRLLAAARLLVIVGPPVVWTGDAARRSSP